MTEKKQYSESSPEFRQKLELPYNRMGWAFEERPDLDPTASHILLTLAFKARNGGTSTVAVETVCRLTRLSRPTVRAALKRLVLAGLIVATGKSPGRWTNKYRLALAPYTLKMPTPGEPGPTPKRFPRTGKRAEVRTIEPVRSEPVEPVQPESSFPVEPESSLPRKTRRVRKTKKNGSLPSIQNKERTGSASAPPARVNGASAPSAPSNGNSASTGKKGSPKPWHCADIPQVTLDLNDYLTSATGRPLDGAWCRYSDLEHQMDLRDFWEVGDILGGILDRTGGALPEPEKFFGAYGEYQQAHLARQRSRNDGRRRAA